jgi:hypothetical protein
MLRDTMAGTVITEDMVMAEEEGIVMVVVDMDMDMGMGMGMVMEGLAMVDVLEDTILMAIAEDITAIAGDIMVKVADIMVMVGDIIISVNQIISGDGYI